MRITLRQLQHLSVETRSGVKLGKVHDIVFETDGQIVAQYVVKPFVIGRGEYRIASSQVARFEETKMVVDDAVSHSAIGGEKSRPGIVASPSAAMRKEV